MLLNIVECCWVLLDLDECGVNVNLSLESECGWKGIIEWVATYELQG